MKLDLVPAQPVIEAGRFLLRPQRKSDAGLLGLYTAERRLAEATRSIPHPLPPGATDAYVARALSDKRTEDVWAMDGTGHGLAEVLGVIGLTRMDARPASAGQQMRLQSEVSYWVAPAFWNAGYASEAVRALVDANPHRASTIFAEVFQDNPVSARVLTNCGFEYLGDAEAYSVARGATVPTWTYLNKRG